MGAAVLARVALGLAFPLLARMKYRDESVSESLAAIVRHVEPAWQVYEVLPFVLLGVVCATLPQRASRRAAGLFLAGLAAFSAIYCFGYLSVEAYMSQRAWTAASLAAGLIPMKCLGVVVLAFLARLILGRARESARE